MVANGGITMTMIASRAFISPALGNVRQGDRLENVDPDSGFGRHLASHGLARPVEGGKSAAPAPGRDYGTKVEPAQPQDDKTGEGAAGQSVPSDAGGGVPSSSSPADQAPTKRKRGRPRKHQKPE